MKKLFTILLLTMTSLTTVTSLYSRFLQKINHQAVQVIPLGLITTHSKKLYQTNYNNEYENQTTSKVTDDGGIEVSYPDGTKITHYADNVTEYEPPIDDD